MKKELILILAFVIFGTARCTLAQNPGPCSVSSLEVMTNRLQFDQLPVVLCGWLVKLRGNDNYGLFPSLEEAEHRLYASAFLIHLSQFGEPASQELSQSFRRLNGKYVEIQADFKNTYYAFRNDRDTPFSGHLINIQEIKEKQNKVRDEINLDTLKPFDFMPEWVRKKQENGGCIEFEEALAHPRASHGDEICVNGYWKQLSENVFGVFRNKTEAEYENPGSVLLVNFKDSNLPVSLENAKAMVGYWVGIRGSYFSELCTLKSCQKEVTIGRIGFVQGLVVLSKCRHLSPSNLLTLSRTKSEGKEVLPSSWVHSVEELVATPEYLDSTVYVQGFVDNSNTPTLWTRYSTPSGRIFFGNSEFSMPKYQKYHGKAVLMRGKLVIYNSLLYMKDEEILDVYPPSSEIKNLKPYVPKPITYESIEFDPE